MRNEGQARAGTLIRRSWQVPILAAWLTLLVVSPASADFYQFTFGGVVDIVDGIVPAPWEDVHVGSEFEFSYVFDSEAEDQIGNPWYGLYYIESAVVTIDGIPQATSEGMITITNKGPDDSYMPLILDLPIGASGGVDLSGWDVIDTDELPLDIDLDDWDDELFEIISPDFEIRGHITSFDGKVIPAPAVLPILIIGVLYRMRPRRQQAEIPD